jgi:hypothetical protein
MGRASWLCTLHPLQEERVREVIAQRRGTGWADRKGSHYGLSIVLDRSVDVPHSILLRYKDRFGQVVWEEQIDASLPPTPRSVVDAAWSEV